MGSNKKSPEKELNMMSTYMLTALLVLLPLTFIPQAESGKPHAHPDPHVKIDDSCVFTGLSCFDGWNNITEVLVGLAEPADCGRQCQNNLPECVWWTMTNQDPLGRQSASYSLAVMHQSTPLLSLASTIVLLKLKSK